MSPWGVHSSTKGKRKGSIGSSDLLGCPFPMPHKYEIMLKSYIRVCKPLLFSVTFFAKRIKYE